MKFLRKLLTPALLLTSFLGGEAFAQEKPVLPDAPIPATQLKLTPLHFNYSDYHLKPNAPSYDVPLPKHEAPALGDGFVGKLAGYVDRHTNDVQQPFDLALEYQLKDRFTLVAGSLSDIRKHSGQYEATRQSLRVTTGLPDWETANMRDAMAGGMPQYAHPRNGEGVAIGFRIRLDGR